jgi:hypothetical protein
MATLAALALDLQQHAAPSVQGSATTRISAVLAVATSVIRCRISLLQALSAPVVASRSETSIGCHVLCITWLNQHLTLSVSNQVLLCDCQRIDHSAALFSQAARPMWAKRW